MFDVVFGHWTKKLLEMPDRSIIAYWDGGNDSGDINCPLTADQRKKFFLSTDDINDIIIFIDTELDYGAWAGNWHSYGDVTISHKHLVFTGNESDSENLIEDYRDEIGIPIPAGSIAQINTGWWPDDPRENLLYISEYGDGITDEDRARVNAAIEDGRDFIDASVSDDHDSVEISAIIQGDNILSVSVSGYYSRSTSIDREYSLEELLEEHLEDKRALEELNNHTSK